MSFHSKQMQDRENRNINNAQPLGICKRLLNFIMNILTAQGLPHLTNPPASQSIPVPVEGSSAFREEHDYHPENSNSEIRVDFRHTNELEHHAAKNDNAIVKGKKGGFRSVEIGIVRPTRNVEIDSRGQVNGQELNSITTGGSRAKLPTEVVSINDRGREKEKNNNKDKSTAAGEAEDTPMMPPFDFLENDINGRADEFIRRRKMDFLRRNPTLDLPKSN
ncbi:hypothetical protein RHMOL_Rhmol01G0365300 [Rhododendron molle]|uniref:Uncharacterized protein n=1 Tax=Rhododendron molle TaxID=49168 RepID=A0ACC0Q979_RHOML|nr:hypothetical protein RHMOL_Rhmol01G0365300 [Rhododendron molle]